MNWIRAATMFACALALLAGCSGTQSSSDGRGPEGGDKDWKGPNGEGVLGHEICPGNACGEGCDPCGPWAICVDGSCQAVDCDPSCGWDSSSDGCGGVCDGSGHDDEWGYYADAYAAADCPGYYYEETMEQEDSYSSCQPSCWGKQCGADGCGGSCGSCPSGTNCQNGQCKTAGGACVPDCVGLEAGESDGCGGLCAGGGTSIGLVPGGAQDAGYFKLLVKQGKVPEPGLLPIEGWLTEHGTPLPDPDPDKALTLHAFLGLMYHPAYGKELVALQMGMNSGLSPEQIEAGQFNLSVVVDRSGSMSGGNIEAVKEGLLLMVDTLDSNDILSIVVYQDYGEVLLPATPVTDKAAIKELISSIHSAGSTNLYEGMVLGYTEVIKNIDSDRINRIMLLSDGMTNSGVTNLDQILAKSKEYNEQGIGITTIGVGTGFNFDLMHLLSTQGNGNFYFIDTAAKLVEVFQEDIKYLLTPVAFDLHVSFTLTDGFEVAEVFGFDYKMKDGKVILLAPSPEYDVGPDTSGNPPITPGPDDGDGGTEVSVPSLNASKKNGLLMTRLTGPGSNSIAGMSELVFAQVEYSYTLADSGKTESWTRPVDLGTIEVTDQGNLLFFSGPIVERNMCLLQMALSMREACRLYHEENAVVEAGDELDFATLVCERINKTVQDQAITDDLVLLDNLKSNIGN